MNIDLDALQEVYNLLQDGFHWAKAPQGNAYWLNVIADLYMISPLVDETYPSCGTVAPYPPAPGTCNKIIFNLRNAFPWSASPQGAECWTDVVSHLMIVRGHETYHQDAKANNDSFDDYDRAMRGI